MKTGAVYGPNPTGAGMYGGDGPTHKTACRHSNNPAGRNPACACGWAQRERASQVVPYAEPGQDPEFPESPHDHWWPAENDYYGDRMREERAFGD